MKDHPLTDLHIAIAAEHGDAEAQYNLGSCYAKGRGVRRDYAKAAALFRTAAAQLRERAR